MRLRLVGADASFRSSVRMRLRLVGAHGASLCRCACGFALSVRMRLRSSVRMRASLVGADAASLVGAEARAPTALIEAG
jgi:hypothetical protein